VTHYKDGVLAPTAPPPFFYQNNDEQPPTEPQAQGPPTQPNAVAVPSAVSGAVVGYVDELTIHTSDDKVVQAIFSIVDHAGNTLTTVELQGNRCVNAIGALISPMRQSSLSTITTGDWSTSTAATRRNGA
jgi:hypothetical protein